MASGRPSNLKKNSFHSIDKTDETEQFRAARLSIGSAEKQQYKYKVYQIKTSTIFGAIFVSSFLGRL